MRPTTEAPANSPPACVDEVEPRDVPSSPVFPILFALSFAHLVNDTLQSLIPAIYPILKSELRLDYSHIGLITLTNQLTASLLQPFVGAFTDRRPQPFSLAAGMASTLLGLVLLSTATSLALVLVAVAFVGIGSSVFHPEASRVAHLSSGGRLGFAQSVFQVGGNAGSSLGPLLAAAIVVSRGQRSIMWFSVLALTGILILTRIGSGIGRALLIITLNGTRQTLDLHRDFPVAADLVFSHPDCPGFFEVLLSREHEQLLHVLLIQKFGLQRAQLSTAPIHIPRRDCRRHISRRTNR